MKLSVRAHLWSTFQRDLMVITLMIIDLDDFVVTWK